MSEAIVRVVASLREIAAEAWDACANPRPDEAFNPFVCHDFLGALEDSGSAVAERGWAARHIVLEGAGGEIAGVAPCYLKSHSYGEYVFDHAWADAWQRVGGRYYPKLQIAVPFTPATGPRLLVRPGAEAESSRRQLAAAAIAFAERSGASSVHATFLEDDEWRLFADAGYLQRTDQQFHWRNDGYYSFDDFVGTLASRKRKAVRKERQAALSTGIEIEWVTGRAITEAHLDDFFEFYLDTGGRKWGSPYLTRSFFSLIGERMADRILLVFARRAGKRIAGAINFIGSDTLYGRYWGCVEDHPFLHFEVCYYQAIDFALENGLAFVEAGAQGAHKLARGYLPVTTRSAHYIADPNLRRAIADYLDNERRHVEFENKILIARGPYRKDGSALDRSASA